MIIRHVTSFVYNLVHSGEHMWTARIRVAYFLQIPSRGLRRRKRRRKRRRRRRRLENPQERNNGRLFRKLFSADCRDSSSLSRTKTVTRGGEGVLKRRRKSEYKQNRERKDGEREEEKEEEDMEDEEVEGHCDCLALTFASHILPGCQWHSTGEFSIATSSLCSRTETRYLI